MPVGAYSSSTANPVYVVSGRIGVDITKTYTSASGPKNNALGDVVHCTRGERFMFVKAGSTIALGDVLFIAVTGSATTIYSQEARPATIAFSSAFRKVAVATLPIASGDYGWVLTGGGAATVNLAASVQPLVPLFFTSTGGQLASTVSSQACCLGLVALSSSSSGGASLVQCALADTLTVGWNGGL
jgi:hypothetical protein